jgi:CHAT domain-containing protein
MKYRRAAIVVVGVAGLSSLGIRWFERPPVARPGRIELLRALGGGSRPFEGYVIGFPLAPYQEGAVPVLAGGKAGAIALQIEEAAERQGNARDLADQALVELLVGKPDKAVSLLESAARLEPSDAGILSDLSAAYLAQARRDAGDPMPRIRALSLANRALRLNPHLREAVCNRALALENYYLLPLARAAWKDCWRAGGEEASLGDEAAGHLLRIRPAKSGPPEDLRTAALSEDTVGLSRIVAKSPRSARILAEQELGAWAAASLSGRNFKARQSLSIVRALGEALWQVGRDTSFRDVVSAIEKPPRPAALRLMALGFQAYRNGIEHEQARTALLSRAAERLEKSGSPFHLRVQYQIALALEPKNHDLACRRLFQVAERARERGYKGWLGDALWMAGLREMDNGNPDAAQRAYKGSVAAFESARDLDGVLGARNLLAEYFDEMGDLKRIWENRQAVLAQIARGGDPLRCYQIYVAAATGAFQQGFPEVALDFQTEAVRQAESVSLLAKSQALMWQGRYHWELGLHGLARLDLKAAADNAAAVLESSERERAESDILLAEAEARLKTSPVEAVELLTQSILRFKRTGHEAHHEYALLLRARAERQLGRSRAAAADLEMAIRLIEDKRYKIGEDDLKALFLSGAREAYDEMILLQAQVLDDPQTALDFLEKKRARTLLDRLHSADPSGKSDAQTPKPVTPLPLAVWANRLPQGTVFLSYAEVGGKWLAWLVDSKGLRDFRILAQDERLQESAQRIQLAANDREFSVQARSAAATLYDLLIRPFEAEIPAGSYLVIGRDDLLDGVPFSLLLDRKTSHYLIESHPIVMAPSGNHYVESLQLFRSRARAGRSFFIGEPEHDHEAFPDLDPLPWALSEAKRSAVLYGRNANLLSGDAATEDAFRVGLRHHDLIQFSGHAIGGALGSALVLAPSNGEDGLLHAYEIYRLHVERARLVILAACGSAQKTTSLFEGTQSLSTAFLAAGVPVVMGTLWNIRDQASLELLVDFHAGLRRGMDPAASLQAAQIRFLKSQDSTRRSPLTWAAFELTGGVLPFADGR